MSNRACEEFQRSMEPLLDAEGLAEPPADLREHLEHCPECAQFHALLGSLRQADLHAEPSDVEFLAMRRGVLREIRHLSSRGPSLLEGLGAFFRRPAVALSGATLLLAVTFLAGRHSLPRPGLPAAPEDAMLGQIKLAALQNRGLRDLDKAPYLYDNVRMDDLGGGQVALNFDVSRHVTLSLPVNDPVVADVLAQTLVGASPTGTKLQVMDCAGESLDPRVREGLITVMLADPNLGVRLKAQAKLMEQPGDPRIQEALLRVLQHEESVQMKLVAIDYLTRHRIDPNLIREAIAPAGKRDAVYLRAMNYLNDNGGTS